MKTELPHLYLLVVSALILLVVSEGMAFQDQLDPQISTSGRLFYLKSRISNLES